MEKEGIFNYITSHTGFTLNDLVSYDGKHNEANGENNQDGPDYNYSWNCGAEGPSRKKAVCALRNRQIKNALFLCCLRRERHAFWQEMNSGTHREAITMSIVRITLQAG